MKKVLEMFTSSDFATRYEDYSRMKSVLFDKNTRGWYYVVRFLFPTQYDS